MREELEIERGWLLKSVPQGASFDRSIKQYYFIEDGIFKRVRESNYINRTEYHLTIKTPRGGGKIGFIEAEEEISKETFLEKLEMAVSYIHKDRFIRHCKLNEGLVWEIDNFISIPMIKMEMELPSDGYELLIPQDIRELIILETTGMKEFSNALLAKKLVL